MVLIAQFYVDPFYYQCPSAATIVTTHSEGGDNAMAVAWHTAVARTLRT